MPDMKLKSWTNSNLPICLQRELGYFSVIYKYWLWFETLQWLCLSVTLFLFNLTIFGREDHSWSKDLCFACSFARLLATFLCRRKYGVRGYLITTWTLTAIFFEVDAMSTRTKSPNPTVLSQGGLVSNSQTNCLSQTLAGPKIIFFMFETRYWPLLDPLKVSQIQNEFMRFIMSPKMPTKNYRDFCPTL